MSFFCQQCLSLGLFCRSHCYKIIFTIIAFFILTQYTTNILFKNHIPKLISPSLSWASSISAHRILGLESQSNAVSQTANIKVSSLKNSTANNDINVTSENKTDLNFSFETIPLVSWNLTSKINKTLQLCPMVPPKLVGRLKVLTDAPEMTQLEKNLSNLEPGGRYKPSYCQSRNKVAIIVPYRDREHHLRIFLHNIHPILQRQQLDYGIYVVEEAGKTKFNRALLMNIGFAEASRDYEYSCFIFHDVDLIPEDDRNLYTCPTQPRHMSVAIDIFNYRLPYKDIFGGVGALTKEHMEKVNGFSNEFWGWGGEDDDMSNRLRFNGLKISRYPTNIARYKMLSHSKDEPNPERYNKLYKGKKRFKSDGINNLKYKRLDFVLKKLYTWVLVDIKPPAKRG